MSSINLDPVTFNKLIDPWMDSCSPACHTLNLSTWKDLESQSTDGKFLCPFSRNVLTINSLRKNTLAADLIAQNGKDKKNKTFTETSDSKDKYVVKVLKKMEERMEKRDALLIGKIDTLTRVIWVSHKQTMNLSEMSWGDTFLMTMVPCKRKELLKEIKNRGITRENIQLVDDCMKKYEEQMKK
ncbi:hypothetical protein PHSC3_001340 [Chlamydiales bacterium STE3]|nr:hypothetical protein PHSC3_001340 [Chlamydiales bacterium STE3]